MNMSRLSLLTSTFLALLLTFALPIAPGPCG